MEPTIETMEALWTDLVELDAHVEVQEKPVDHHYDVRLLHRDNATDWRWFPWVMDRVRNFCIEYENQSDTDSLVRSIQGAFVTEDPGLAVFAFIRDDQLIGHLLADRSILYFKPIVTVHQYHLDHGVTTEIRDRLLTLLKNWARYPGPRGDREPAQCIQWLVRNKKLANMYQRTFKAKPHLLLMRMEV